MSHERHDDLWDRGGEPDPELRALEHELRRYRWTGTLPALEARRPRRARRVLLAAAAALVAALVLRDLLRDDAPRYAAEWRSADGARRAAPLAPGDHVRTDADSSARVRVGDVGHVELAPRGSLRIAAADELPASDARHLLHLERGLLRASIFAAPRVFQLGTPGGLAVDMGCIYTTEVLDDGLTRLRVESGQVSFESPARQVTVPAGASLTARPAAGPGTPAWDDAPASYRARLERADRGAADASDLQALLAESRPRDSLSLAHLLDVAPGGWRAPLVARLAELAPPPEPSLPERVLAGERAALERWKRAMDWWW